MHARLPSVGKTIKSQLIVLLFGLSGLAIVVVAIIGIRGLLDSGSKAQDITGRAMQQRAEQLMVQTVNATAAENRLQLLNSQANVTKVATYIKNVFENPANFTSAWRFDDHVKKQPTNQWWNAPTELPNILLQNFIKPDAAMKKRVEALHQLDLIGPQLLASDSNAVALYFIGDRGESFYYPNIDLGNIVPPDFDPRSPDFYTVGMPQNDPDRTVVWTPVYDDPAGTGLTITASHPVYLGDTFQGVASVDLSLNAIAKSIESYSPIESSYAFLIDKDGRAVALPSQGYTDLLDRSPKKDEFGADLSKVSGQFATVLADMRAGRDGFTNANANHESLYVAYAPLKDTPFSLGIVARKDVLLKAVADLRAQVKNSTGSVLYLQILPFAGIILLFIWALGLFYIRRITDPIVALTVRAHEITQGSFTGSEIKVQSSPSNEVGKLSAAFNTMTHELGNLYNQLQAKIAEVGSANAKDEAILNSIGDGMIVTGESGHTLFINETAERLLDVKHVKQGQVFTMPKLYDEQDKLIDNKDLPSVQALATHQKVSQTVTAVDDADNKTILSVTATPVLQHGQTIGVVQLIRDVTKERQIDRMKSEFLSVASHQLRTPLSAISWFSEMLQPKDGEQLDPKEVKLAADNIHASSIRMTELVNSLLNVSRIDSGRIVVEPKPTDVKELLSILVEDLKSRNSDRKLTLEVSVDPAIGSVNLDPQLISQVYLNLLTNAIKYSPKDGKITVTVKKDGNNVLSQISDEGVGVPKAEQDKMFQRFFRATNAQKVDTDGTGLGLYLVKAIVESSGGKIWFESQENKGTTFWFTLPYKQTEPEKPKAS